MKQNKLRNSVLLALHIIAFLAIMIIAQLGGDAASNIVSVNGYVDNLIFTVVYIGITLSVGLLYAKYILHFSCEEIGVCLKAPQLKWIITAFALPLAVMVFYLIFADGELVKNNNAGGISYFLFSAIFYVGISAGVCEEFIFRGLIMRTLERKWNKAAAVFVPSILFAFIHTINMRLNPVDMLLLLVAGTAVGVMFSLIALQSGTIWSSAIVHSVWNAIIIGGVFIIEAPASGLTANFFYRYELTGTNVLITGGRFGIESALPAIIGYCLVSVMAFVFLKKQSEKNI